MKHVIPLILLAIATAAPAAGARETIGIFFAWGAFREPGRCFAIAEPAGPKRPDRRPFVSIASWPERGVRSQLHVRLSREKRPGSAILLRIDDATFQLGGGRNNAWALDRRADAAIVAAMRTGLQMSVETRSATGALVRDRYGLRGAASAIDASAIACAGR